jgi:hypothetical protein
MDMMDGSGDDDRTCASFCEEVEAGTAYEDDVFLRHADHVENVCAAFDDTVTSFKATCEADGTCAAIEAAIYAFNPSTTPPITTKGVEDMIEIVVDVVSLTMVVPLDVDLSSITATELVGVKEALIAAMADVAGFDAALVERVILSQNGVEIGRRRREEAAKNGPITATIIFKADAVIDVTAATASLNLAIEAGTVSVTVMIGGEEVTAIVTDVVTGKEAGVGADGMTDDGIVAIAEVLDDISEADIDGIVELLSAAATFQPVGVVVAIMVALLGVVGV